MLVLAASLVASVTTNTAASAIPSIPIVAHNLMKPVVTGQGCTILRGSNAVQVASDQGHQAAHQLVEQETRCGLFFGFVWLKERLEERRDQNQSLSKEEYLQLSSWYSTFNEEVMWDPEADARKGARRTFAPHELNSLIWKGAQDLQRLFVGVGRSPRHRPNLWQILDEWTAATQSPGAACAALAGVVELFEEANAAGVLFSMPPAFLLQEVPARDGHEGSFCGHLSRTPYKTWAEPGTGTAILYPVLNESSEISGSWTFRPLTKEESRLPQAATEHGIRLTALRVQKADAAGGPDRESGPTESLVLVSAHLRKSDSEEGGKRTAEWELAKLLEAAAAENETEKTAVLIGADTNIKRDAKHDHRYTGDAGQLLAEYGATSLRQEEVQDRYRHRKVCRALREDPVEDVLYPRNFAGGNATLQGECALRQSLEASSEGGLGPKLGEKLESVLAALAHLSDHTPVLAVVAPKEAPAESNLRAEAPVFRPAVVSKAEQLNFWEAARDGDAATVRKLIEGGKADLERKHPDSGRTALMLAALEGHDAVVETLLHHGASIDSVDDDGETALMSAAEFGHPTVVRILIQNNADTQLKNVQDQTALNLAEDLAEEGDDVDPEIVAQITEMLREAGVKRV